MLLLAPYCNPNLMETTHDIPNSRDALPPTNCRCPTASPTTRPYPANNPRPIDDRTLHLFSHLHYVGNGNDNANDVGITTTTTTTTAGIPQNTQMDFHPSPSAAIEITREQILGSETNEKDTVFGSHETARHISHYTALQHTFQVPRPVQHSSADSMAAGTLFNQPIQSTSHHQPALTNLLAAALLSPTAQSWSADATAVHQWRIPAQLESEYMTLPTSSGTTSYGPLDQTWFLSAKAASQSQNEPIYTRLQRARPSQQTFFPYIDTVNPESITATTTTSSSSSASSSSSPSSSSSSTATSPIFISRPDRPIHFSWTGSNCHHTNIQQVTESDTQRHTDEYEPPFSLSPSQGQSDSSPYVRVPSTVPSFPVTYGVPSAPVNARQSPDLINHPSPSTIVVIRRDNELAMTGDRVDRQSDARYAAFAAIANIPVEPASPAPTRPTVVTNEERMQRLRQHLLDEGQCQVTTDYISEVKVGKRRKETPSREQSLQVAGPLAMNAYTGRTIACNIVPHIPPPSSTPIHATTTISPSTSPSFSRKSRTSEPSMKPRYAYSRSPTPTLDSPLPASARGSSEDVSLASTSKRTRMPTNSIASSGDHDLDATQRRLQRRRERNRLAARRSRDKKSTQFAELRDRHDMLVDECARLREQVMLLDQRNRLLELHTQQLMSALQKREHVWDTGGRVGGSRGRSESREGNGIGRNDGRNSSKSSNDSRGDERDRGSSCGTGREQGELESDGEQAEVSRREVHVDVKYNVIM